MWNNVGVSKAVGRNHLVTDYIQKSLWNDLEGVRKLYSDTIKRDGFQSFIRNTQIISPIKSSLLMPDLILLQSL